MSKQTFILIGIIAVLLGGFGGYSAWAISNDVKAESMLRDARKELQGNRRDAARAKFEEIVKTYPRTDAAAAAMYALFRMLDQDRATLQKNVEAQLKAFEAARAADQKKLTDLQAAKTTVAVTAPKPPPAPAKKVTKKAPTRKTTKKAPVKRKTTRRR